MIAESLKFVLAENNDGWARLLVPIVIAVFYVLSLIGKSRAESQQQAEEEEAKASKPQSTKQPRPAPRSYTERPGARAPTEVARRGTTVPQKRTGMPEPTPVSEPKSIGKLEQKLQEKLQRAEREIAQRLQVKAARPSVTPPKAAPAAAEVKPVSTVHHAGMDTLADVLRNHDAIRQAIVLREILDMPLGLRKAGPSAPSGRA